MKKNPESWEFHDNKSENISGERIGGAALIRVNTVYSIKNGFTNRGDDNLRFAHVEMEEGRKREGEAERRWMLIDTTVPSEKNASAKLKQ